MSLKDMSSIQKELKALRKENKRLAKAKTNSFKEVVAPPRRGDASGSSFDLDDPVSKKEQQQAWQQAKSRKVRRGRAKRSPSPSYSGTSMPSLTVSSAPSMSSDIYSDKPYLANKKGHTARLRNIVVRVTI